MYSRRLRWGVGALLLAFLGEGLSVSWLPAPPVDRRPLVQLESHADLGYQLVPGQESFSYQAPVLVNNDGLRERPQLPPECQRMLFVGGSETFGKGVAVEETFVRRVEEGIGPGWCTINAGTPDWNLHQSVAFVRHYAPRYAPKVVVLVFDWDDLFFDASTGEAAAGQTEASEWFLRRWAQKSGALEWMAPVYTRSRLLYAARNITKNSWGRMRGTPATLWQEDLLNGTPSQDLQTGFEFAQDELRQFSLQAKAQGFDPYVVLLPMRGQIIQRGVSTYFQKEATRRAGAHGLGVIDVREDFKAGLSQQFIPYDGHPSALGHARIAEGVLRGLKDYQQTP